MSIAGNVRVYRRKPLAVEAIQLTDDNTEKVKDFWDYVERISQRRIFEEE